MSLGAFLQGVVGGVDRGLGDVQQVQQIRAEGQKQSAQADAARYMQDAIKNGTDPMDVAQNMAAFSMRAGDQQAAGHWYGVYNDQKAVKTGHALVEAYTAADQGDPDLAVAKFNHYSTLGGGGDTAEVVPHVDPASGQETRTVAVVSPDGRRTVLPPAQWQSIAKARLAIELSNLKTQQEMPFQQRVWGAQAGNLDAEAKSTTELIDPRAAQLRGAANAANAEAGSTTALIGPRAAGLYAGAEDARANAASTRALIGPRVAEGFGAANASNAQAEDARQRALTTSAERSGQVAKLGMDVVEGAARTSAYADEAQSKRVMQPVEQGLKESQAKLAREEAGYYGRDGRARTPKGPQPWTREDQASLDAAIEEQTGVGNDPVSGAKVTSGQPSYPELAHPANQRATRALAQSLMTSNPDTLRNNAPGAAELAAAIVAKRVVVIPRPGTNTYVVNFGGAEYVLPAAALAGAAQIPAGGPAGPRALGGPSVPMQR